MDIPMQLYIGSLFLQSTDDKTVKKIFLEATGFLSTEESFILFKNKEVNLKNQEERRKIFSFLLSQYLYIYISQYIWHFSRISVLLEKRLTKPVSKVSSLSRYTEFCVVAPLLKDKPAMCWDANSVTRLSFPYLAVTIPYFPLPDTLINSQDKQNYILKSHSLTKTTVFWIPNHSLLKAFLPF